MWTHNDILKDNSKSRAQIIIDTCTIGRRLLTFSFYLKLKTQQFKAIPKQVNNFQTGCKGNKDTHAIGELENNLMNANLINTSRVLLSPKNCTAYCFLLNSDFKSEKDRT